MSLRMPGPWKHPTTGVYYLRQRRPADLASAQFADAVAIPVGEAIKLVNVGSVVKVSLATKDPTEAKARHRDADAALQEFWRRRREGPQPLTQRQVQALAGLLYVDLVAMMDSEPGEEGIWHEVLRLSQRVQANGNLDPWFGPTVDELFAKQGVVTDELSRTRVVHAALKAIQLAAETNLKKAQGDYSPDEIAKRFPPWQPERGGVPESASVPVGKFDLFALLDHKFQTQSLKQKTREDYRGYLGKFVEMIGHSDARQVTKDEVREWRDKLIAEGLSSKTINDKYRAALSAVLSHAVEEFGLADNVAKGIRDKREAPAPNGPKGYNLEQASAILTATFGGTSKAISIPHQRALFWVPWICAYTGLRVSEVTQLQGANVREEGGIACLLITPTDGSTKSGKAWMTAVHPHLVELGLLDMFRTVGDGPAFYVPYPPETNLASLPVNSRAKEAGNRVGEWITSELGIPAPGGKPNHAWRHLFTTLTRDHSTDKQARDYMMGSGPKDAREGYGDWSAVALHREISKLPSFVVPESCYRPSNEQVPAQPMRRKPEIHPSCKKRSRRG